MMTIETRFPHAWNALNKRLAQVIDLGFVNAKLMWHCGAQTYTGYASTDKLLACDEVRHIHPTPQSVFDARAKLVIRAKEYNALLATLPSKSSYGFWEICEALCGVEEVAEYTSERKRDVCINRKDGDDIVIYHGYGKSNTTMLMHEAIFMRGLATRHIRMVRLMKEHKAKVQL